MMQPASAVTFTRVMQAASPPSAVSSDKEITI